MATPILAARQLLKNFSSALHQNGLLITARAVERRVLEIGAVEGDVLGDAVDDHGVLGGLALDQLVDADGLGGDAARRSWN